MRHAQLVISEWADARVSVYLMLRDARTMEKFHDQAFAAGPLEMLELSSEAVDAVGSWWRQGLLFAPAPWGEHWKVG